MKRLSVVIANYNYAEYVAIAIESALALRWPDVEVVVVDDGSTDDSAAVIRRYDDRVKILLTDNATQRVAVNRGYAMTTGDAVIFLDSDDALPPDLPERLAEVLAPSVSKVQFQVQRVDQTGAVIGTPFPVYNPVPTPADIRRWAVRTTAYPTPPGSGNAYARWFLDRIFPVGPDLGDAADSACLAVAPFAGDVVSVPGTIVAYRQHDRNDSDLLKDHRRFPREVARARARWRFAQTVGGADPDAIDEQPLFRSRELLQLRVAAWRMAHTERPLPGDGWSRLMLDTLRAPFQVGPERPWPRAVIVGWCVATLVAPRRVAKWLVAYRYGSRR